MTTVALIALLGIVGLAVDLGCIFNQKLKAQIAADAAVLAAALTPYDADLSDNLNAAKALAAINGFAMDDPVAAVAVVVHSPPNTGPVEVTTSAPGDYYEAIITQEHPTYFLNLVGMTSFPIMARSVAGVDKARAEGGPCVTVGDAVFSSNTNVLAKYCRFYFSGTLTTISGAIAKGYATNQYSPIFSPLTIVDPGMPLPTPPGDGNFPLFSGGSSVSCPKAKSGYTQVSSLTPGVYQNIHINGTCTLAGGEYKISGLMSFVANANSSGEGLIFMLKAGARINTDGRMYLRSGAPGYEDYIIWAQAPPDIALASYTSGSGTVTKAAPTLTFSYEPGAGENRLLLVSVVTGAVSPTGIDAPKISDVRFNGVKMTQVGEAAATDKTNKVEVRAYLFQMLEAALPVGPANLIVTAKGLANDVDALVFAGATTYRNVNQDTPLGGTTTAVVTGGGGSAITLTGITSATGELVHGLVGVDADGSTVGLSDGGGQTRVGTFDSNDSNFPLSAALSTKAGADSLSLSWSWSGDQTAAALAVPLKRLESHISYGEKVKPLYEDIPGKRQSIYGHIYAPGVPFDLGGKHNLSIPIKTHLVEWIE